MAGVHGKPPPPFFFNQWEEHKGKNLGDLAFLLARGFKSFLCHGPFWQPDKERGFPS